MCVNVCVCLNRGRGGRSGCTRACCALEARGVLIPAVEVVAESRASPGSLSLHGGRASALRRSSCALDHGMSDCEEASPEPPLDDCLKTRKWWCFLLSSIFTFLAGLTIVLLWRAFAFICCRKEPEFSPNDPKQKEQKAARGKQEFEGTFMTEAKDWAGELISGQTTTGRILVSTTKNLFHL